MRNRRGISRSITFLQSVHIDRAIGGHLSFDFQEGVISRNRRSTDPVAGWFSAFRLSLST
jgi:hypothetical protein